MIQQDLITKTLAVFSPKAAMTRMADQARLRNFGRFDSALDSTKRGISRNISGAEDTAGTAERYKLIRAARDLADNFPPVRSLLLKFATYVAGRISYQARTGDKELDDQIERYWIKWCKECDFLRRHNFTTFVQLAVVAILRDGDCGFIIVRDGEMLKLQAVEADRIGSPYNRLIDSDSYIGGIMLDEFGRPDKYQIFVRTINNQYIEPTDIAGERVHPPFRPDAAWTNTVAARLSRPHSTQLAICKRRSRPKCRRLNSRATKPASSPRRTAAPTPPIISPRATGMISGKPRNSSNIDPGAIQYLSPGEKMEMFRSDRPGGAFREFVQLVQSHIAMTVGLPYGFAFDADKSGPMARMEAAMAERTFARWRGMLESQFLDRIKNIVLLDAAARGLIPDNEYLLDGRWCWPAKVSIDYGREASADISLWKAGLKTASQIYDEHGEDYEEALRQRAKEADMIKELGIEYKIQPIRISDSVPQTVLDSEPIEGEEQTPPLIDSIGIGGTDALAKILDAMGQGTLTPEQVAIIFVEVFGMSKEAAANLIQNAQPAQAQPQEAALAEGIDLKPTAGMVAEAKKGLEWRKEYGRGGTNIGVARARDISNGKNMTEDTVRRMHSYFSRHEVDKKGKGFSPGEDGFPSAGRIAWALWGGDAGQAWAAKKVEQINRNRKLKRKEKAVAHMKRDDHGRVMGFELKAEIVLPTPEADEELEDFIDRAVVDETMELEYPDEKQRIAACKALFKK
jgi:capsid protein